MKSGIEKRDRCQRRPKSKMADVKVVCVKSGWFQKWPMSVPICQPGVKSNTHWFKCRNRHIYATKWPVFFWDGDIASKNLINTFLRIMKITPSHCMKMWIKLRSSFWRNCKSGGSTTGWQFMITRWPVWIPNKVR